MKTKQRIIGYDFARAWAMFGMLIVNFTVITGAEGNGPAWLRAFTSLFEGRASALFVILAGIGITLMTKRAVASGDQLVIKASRQNIWKRSMFLLALGLLLYTLEWTGDILHYYGVYLFLAAFLIVVNSRWLVGLALGFLVVAQFLQLRYNAFEGWAGPVPFMNYADFWTIEGFARNLFFNGYHPLFPWFSFFLIGLWLGRMNLQEGRIRKRLLLISIAITTMVEVLSKVLIHISTPWIGTEASTFLFNTGPILPNVLYILSATGTAIAGLILCLYVTERWANSRMVTAIVHTGQLTLTHYVGHVVIGIGFLVLIGRLTNQSLAFALIYSVCFFAFSIVISVVWRKKFSRGPIEWVMRKVTE